MPIRLTRENRRTAIRAGSLDGTRCRLLLLSLGAVPSTAVARCPAVMVKKDVDKHAGKSSEHAPLVPIPGLSTAEARKRRLEEDAGSTEERKRRAQVANCDAQRRCRERKREHVKQLEDENARLRETNALLETQLRECERRLRELEGGAPRTNAASGSASRPIKKR